MAGAPASADPHAIYAAAGMHVHGMEGVDVAAPWQRSSGRGSAATCVAGSGSYACPHVQASPSLPSLSASGTGRPCAAPAAAQAHHGRRQGRGLAVQGCQHAGAWRTSLKVKDTFLMLAAG